MPGPDPSLAWWAPLVALGGLAVVAFLVPWLMTSAWKVPRAVYLAALMVATVGCSWGYLAWSGTTVPLTRHLGLGVVGALGSGVITAGAIVLKANRMRVPRPRGGHPGAIAATLAWEAVLYGAAEGVLLSALPILAAWQAFHILGWTATTAGALGSGALALVASASVIWLHHLGYAEFRHTRRILLPIAACGVLSLAYLLTRSWVAPIVGHMLTHAGMDLRGVAMPPYSGAVWEPPEQEAPTRAVA
jgi:hypothetical protein